MNVAKSVSHSPLRPIPGQAALKNILDTPLKVKWPNLLESAAVQIKEELERSLSGVKTTFTNKNHRKRKRAKTRPNEPCHAQLELPAAKRICRVEEDAMSSDPSSVVKETCREEQSNDTSLRKESQTNSKVISEHLSTDSMPIRGEEAPCDPHSVQEEANTRDGNPTEGTDPKDEDNAVLAKKSQLVVGVNEVTKSLERGKLEAGLLCLSSPSILCRHLLPLVAVRGVPFAAVPDLSRTVASLLGIKRTMCIGVRKVEGTNHFSALTQAIQRLAPPVSIPWLSLDHHGNKEKTDQERTGPILLEQEKGGVYVPLQVKQTKIVPNAKKRRKM